MLIGEYCFFPSKNKGYLVLDDFFERKGCSGPVRVQVLFLAVRDFPSCPGFSFSGAVRSGFEQFSGPGFQIFQIIKASSDALDGLPGADRWMVIESKLQKPFKHVSCSQKM